MLKKQGRLLTSKGASQKWEERHQLLSSCQQGPVPPGRGPVLWKSQGSSLLPRTRKTQMDWPLLAELTPAGNPALKAEITKDGRSLGTCFWDSQLPGLWLGPLLTPSSLSQSLDHAAPVGAGNTINGYWMISDKALTTKIEKWSPERFCWVRRKGARVWYNRPLPGEPLKCDLHS